MMTAYMKPAVTSTAPVSAHTQAAISATITKPVRSVVFTVAVISTASSTTTRSTVTPETASGWHNGMRSGVRLAPMMPAIRAAASASPLGMPSPRSSSTTRGATRTRPVARAVRAVTSLAETSTMRAAPASSRWVRCWWALLIVLPVRSLGQTPYRQALGYEPRARRPDDGRLVQQDHVDFLTGRDRGDRLRYDDQSIAVRQRFDQVRTGATHRSDHAGRTV